MKRALRCFCLWLCCGIPAVAFLAAGIGKGTDPAGFFESIRVYQLIDGPFIGWAVWFLISLEVVGGCALLWPPLRRGGILVLAPLLIAFTLAGISARLRGLEIPCGCFGALEEPAPFGWSSVLRNLALAGLLAGAWALDANRANDPNEEGLRTSKRSGQGGD